MIPPAVVCNDSMAQDNKHLVPRPSILGLKICPEPGVLAARTSPPPADRRYRASRGLGLPAPKYRSVTGTPLVRGGDKAALPLVDYSISYGGCTEHLGGQVGLDDLAGHFGQPCVVAAGLAPQPVESRVHAQAPAISAALIASRNCASLNEPGALRYRSSAPRLTVPHYGGGLSPCAVPLACHKRRFTSRAPPGPRHRFGD